MKKKSKIILGSAITSAVAIPTVAVASVLAVKHHKESDGDQKVATDSSKESLLKTIQGIELNDNEKVSAIPKAEKKGEIAYNQAITKLADLKQAALKENISVQELQKIKEKILQGIQDAKNANSQQQIANDIVRLKQEILAFSIETPVSIPSFEKQAGGGPNNQGLTKYTNAKSKYESDKAIANNLNASKTELENVRNDIEIQVGIAKNANIEQTEANNVYLRGVILKTKSELAKIEKFPSKVVASPGVDDSNDKKYDQFFQEYTRAKSFNVDLTENNLLDQLENLQKQQVIATNALKNAKKANSSQTIFNAQDRLMISQLQAKNTIESLRGQTNLLTNAIEPTNEKDALANLITNTNDDIDAANDENTVQEIVTNKTPLIQAAAKSYQEAIDQANQNYIDSNKVQPLKTIDDINTDVKLVDGAQSPDTEKQVFLRAKEKARTEINTAKTEQAITKAFNDNEILVRDARDNYQFALNTANKTYLDNLKNTHQINPELLKINFPGTYKFVGRSDYINDFLHIQVADNANDFNEQDLSKAIEEKITTFEQSELFQKYGNYIYGHFLNVRTSLITEKAATDFSVNLSETEKITSKTSLSTQKYDNFGQNQYFQDSGIRSSYPRYALFYASGGNLYGGDWKLVQEDSHYYKDIDHNEELSYKNDFEAIKNTNLQFRSLRFGITFNDKQDAQDWVDFIAELHNASLNGSTFAYNDDGAIPLDQNFTKSISDIFKKYSTSLTVSRFINWFITQDIPNNLPILV